MIKRLFRRVANPGRVIAFFSTIISFIGIVQISITIQQKVSGISSISQFILLLEPFDIGLILGLMLLLLILVKSVIGDLYNILWSERKITCGLGQIGTKYDFPKLFDKYCEEVIVVAQNMHTLLSRSDYFPKIIELLKQGTKVRFVLTTYEIMTAINPVSAVHFEKSVEMLRNLYHNDLNDKEREHLSVSFNPAAASLSVVIRDPKKKRAVLLFTPKWATDKAPDNRMYCVIERCEHKELFDYIYGSIVGMRQCDSPNLKQMCEKLNIDWD